MGRPAARPRHRIRCGVQDHRHRGAGAGLGRAAISPIPAVTWQQKIAWMVRLEDQRLLRDPNPPAPAVIRAASATAPAILAPAPPSDLVRLLEDPDARVRGRAALAIGRTGLSDGIDPLSRLLKDPDVDGTAGVRLWSRADRCSRRASGSARGARRCVADGAGPGRGSAGTDRRTRRCDGCGRYGSRCRGGDALSGLRPDDLTYPQAPEVEAARLGIYALVRLGSYEALASVVLDERGQPVSRWWPIAYALQRIAIPARTPRCCRSWHARPLLRRVRGEGAVAHAAARSGESVAPDRGADVRRLRRS